MSPSISRYERRDYLAEFNRRERVQRHIIWTGLAIVLVLLAIYVLRHAPHILSAGPAPYHPVVMVNGEEGDLTTLCARYRSDHLMSGDGMDPQTVKLCGFENGNERGQ